MKILIESVKLTVAREVNPLKNDNRQFYASFVICLLVLPTMAAMVVCGDMPSTIEDSKTTTRTKASETPNILVVFDDGLSPYITPSNTTYALTEALNEAYPSAEIPAIVVSNYLQLMYDGFSGHELDGSSLGDLEEYDIVIWETGSDGLSTLRGPDRTALTNYLSRGGRLWFIGPGVLEELVLYGEDINAALFISDVFGIKISDYMWRGTPTTLTGVSGDSITNGMNIQTQSIYLNGNSLSSSTLKFNINENAVGIFGSPGNYTAVRYNDTYYGFKTVFFGFDFGVIKEKTDRVNICKKVIEWLGFRERHANDVGVTDIYIPRISDVWSSEKNPNANVTFGDIYGMAGREMQINVTARNFDNKSHNRVEIVCEIYEYKYINNLTNRILRGRFSRTRAIPSENEVTETFTWTPPAARCYYISARTVLRSDTYQRNNNLDFGVITIAKWCDNVEGGTNGWTPSTGAEWKIIGDVPNDPNPYNHTRGHAWYCGGTNKYSPNQEAYLNSSTIDLTNIDQNYDIVFAFRINGKTDVGLTAGDFLRLVIRNMTSGSPDIWRALPYWFYNTSSGKNEYALPFDYYGDISDRWYGPATQIKTTKGIKNYVTGFILNWFGDNMFGDKIQVGFLFKSDANTVTSPGFYIDDILIAGFEKFVQLPTDIGILLAYNSSIPIVNEVSPITALIKNYGTTTETFGVKLTIFDEEGNTQQLGDPEALGGVKGITSLSPGNSTLIKWNWKPTAEGKYYYRVELQDISNDNDLSNNVYEKIDWSSGNYTPIVVTDLRTFSLSSSAEPRLYFNSGETKEIDIFLNASGGFSGDVTISTNVGNGWVVPSSTVTLGTNESKIAKITITAPSTNTAQNTTLTITATSAAPARTRIFNTTLTLNETQVIIQYGVELPSTVVPGSTRPGWTVNYTIPIKNIGNTNDSFSLSASTPSGGWSAEFRNSAGSVITNTGDVLSDQSLDVILKIAAPSSVSSGNYDTTITAKSVGNTSKSATLPITTNVTVQPTTSTPEIDFVISSQDIRSSPRTDIVDGDKIQLIATISNNGTLKTPATTVGFYLDGYESINKIGEASLSEIAPKSTQMISIPWIAVGEAHRIYVKVDLSNNVSEISEENNIASVEIKVAQKPLIEEESKGFLPGFELLLVVVAMSIVLFGRSRIYKLRDIRVQQTHPSEQTTKD